MIADEITSFWTHMNTVGEMGRNILPMKSLSDLEVGAEYHIEKLEWANNGYEEAMRVSTGEFMCFLPKRFTKQFKGGSLPDMKKSPMVFVILGWQNTAFKPTPNISFYNV